MDTYECRTCGATFSDEEESSSHAAEAHGLSDTAGSAEIGQGHAYACELCDELFPSREDLEHHPDEHGESEAA